MSSAHTRYEVLQARRQPKESLNKWLRRRIAALRRARSRAYRFDMAWSLRAPRLALHPSRSLIQTFP
ncbi:hypothetical protein OPU71_09475, partial [Niveibacterium sp. 24ML]|uniref:hypothetical protein n=1 Tax=Niveibacterium sp. 24ML TaxID=2985512 RepID=UPI00226E0F7F